MIARVLALLALPLAAQDSSELLVEKVAQHFRYTKGAAWSPEGYLLFSDIPSSKIIKFGRDGHIDTYREDSGGAAGNVFDSQGRLYTCETHARRVTRTNKKGVVEVLAAKWEGKRLNAPSDLAVSHSGQVYFTDLAFGSQSDTRELDFYGVYHITPKGQISVIAKPAGRPNGIALSPNGHVLYVANSDERNIRAYDIGHDGETSGERVLVDAVDGIPLGLRTDDKGNLYVAAKGVLIYSPEGKLLSTITVAELPSGCTFGDPDLHTLYITARTSVYRVRLEAKGAAAD